MNSLFYITLILVLFNVAVANLHYTKIIAAKPVATAPAKKSGLDCIKSFFTTLFKPAEATKDAKKATTATKKPVSKSTAPAKKLGTK